MKNGTHEGDRERATSIVKNLEFNKRISLKHPYFNRKTKKEPKVDLHATDLFLIG